MKYIIIPTKEELLESYGRIIGRLESARLMCATCAADEIIEKTLDELSTLRWRAEKYIEQQQRKGPAASAAAEPHPTPDATGNPVA